LHGRTALHWVTFNGFHRALIWLLRQHADWSARDGAGRSPLHWACDRSDPRCLATLLRHATTASLNAPDARGMTPLAWAAHHGFRRHVRLLLAKGGASAAIADTGGRTPANLAACHATPDCLLALLRACPASAFRADDEGRLPLHAACTYGSLATARWVPPDHLSGVAAGAQGATIVVAALPARACGLGPASWDRLGRIPS